MEHTNIDTYKSTKVLMAPNGELIIALPIYADESGAFIDEKTVHSLAGIKMSIGVYDHVGFICYYPEMGEAFFSKAIAQEFEDLGEL